MRWGDVRNNCVLALTLVVGWKGSRVLGRVAIFGKGVSTRESSSVDCVCKAMSYVVLLYYKYTRLEAVEEVRKWQVGLCERLGLKGRIRLAKEGVNGTVGGNALEVAEYEEEMRKREEFRGVEFKRSTSNAVPFRSLRVEVRPELVTLGLEPDKISYENAGEHITPQSFHEELLRKDRNTVVIDVRNEYGENLQLLYLVLSRGVLKIWSCFST